MVTYTQLYIQITMMLTYICSIYIFPGNMSNKSTALEYDGHNSLGKQAAMLKWKK